MSVSRAKWIAAAASTLFFGAVVVAVSRMPTTSGTGIAPAVDRQLSGVAPMAAFPALSMLCGGSLALVVIAWVGVRAVLDAWRVRKVDQRGEGPFRASSAETWTTRVPRRVLLAWAFNGFAGLALSMFGGNDLRPNCDSLLTLEEIFSCCSRVMNAVDVAAGIMWVAGWLLLVRPMWRPWLAMTSVAYLTVLSVVWAGFSPALSGANAVTLLFALSASAWLAYEAHRCAVQRRAP